MLEEAGRPGVISGACAQHSRGVQGPLGVSPTGPWLEWGHCGWFYSGSGTSFSSSLIFTKGDKF